MYSITISAPDARKATAAMQEVAGLLAPALEKAETLGASIRLDSWPSETSDSAPALPTGEIAEPVEQEQAAPKPRRQRGADKAEGIGAVKPVSGEEGAAATAPSNENEPEGNAATPAADTLTQEPQADSTPSAPTVDYSAVQAVTNQVAAKKGRDAAIALLGEFGVKNGKELTEAQWPEYVNRGEELLAA